MFCVTFPCFHYWNSPICRLPRRTANTSMTDGKAVCRLPLHGKAPVIHFFGKVVLCRLQKIDGRQRALPSAIELKLTAEHLDGEASPAGSVRPLTAGLPSTGRRQRRVTSSGKFMTSPPPPPIISSPSGSRRHSLLLCRLLCLGADGIMTIWSPSCCQIAQLGATCPLCQQQADGKALCRLPADGKETILSLFYLFFF